MWPDESPSAFIDCTMRKLNDEESFEDGLMTISPVFMKELPYPFDYMLENVLDPSHVPFAHHGIFVSDINETDCYCYATKYSMTD